MRTFIKLALIISALYINIGHSDMANTESTTVQMETNKGTITLELANQKAPETVKNFVSYAREGFYNGTIFHRVIPDFMIQGGGFTVDMSPKEAHPPISNEADNGLKNDEGTIAMARTTDPQSATSQFFINVQNNDFLNFKSKTERGWGYAVFGKVTEGMDIVKSIEQVPTENHGSHQDVPVEPVIIEKVTISQ